VAGRFHPGAVRRVAGDGQAVGAGRSRRYGSWTSHQPFFWVPAVDEPHRFGSLGRWRQWIESTFDTLNDQLGLERHGGRTLAGVDVRVAQRLPALAAAIWWNWEIGAPDKRSLVAYDH